MLAWSRTGNGKRLTPCGTYILARALGWQDVISQARWPAATERLETQSPAMRLGFVLKPGCSTSSLKMNDDAEQALAGNPAFDDVSAVFCFPLFEQTVIPTFGLNDLTVFRIFVLFNLTLTARRFDGTC